MRRRSFIQTLFISSGGLLVGKHALANPDITKEAIKVKMIYNNISNSNSLINEWGLSIWFEGDGEAILFDTGGNPQTLFSNIKSAGIDLNKLKSIVISHNHWDHNNGLKEVLKQTNYQPKVYVVQNDLGYYKKEIPESNCIGVSEYTQINGKFSVTEQLKANVGGRILYELSLIVKHKKSLYLFTGCSHPGIVKIVKSVSNQNPENNIELVAGGFHLIRKSEDELYSISKELKELKVNNIAPSHCTGETAVGIFKQQWGEKFISLNLGDEHAIN